MDMMEKLENYIRTQTNYAQRMPEHRATFEAHVFGAIEMVAFLDPEKQDILEKKWYDFKKTLDNLLEV